MKAITSPDLGCVELTLNSTDEQGSPVSKTYRLCFDYRAIKRAEESLGIDIKDFQAWKNIKSCHTPELVLAGLAKHHPDVDLGQVVDALNPEAQALIQDAVFELLFPGVIAKIQKLRDEQAAEASPNVPAGASAAA